MTQDTPRRPPAFGESEAALLEAVVDGFVVIDPEGAIEFVNGAGIRLFGYSRGELLGLNVKILMPAPYHEEHDAYLKRYRETREARIIGGGRIVQGRRKDGSIFPLFLSVTEIEMQGRRLFAGNIHDLTAHRGLEEQLLQSQKMEAIGTLAGGVAHDFNNLLTSILGSAELALRGAESGSPVERALNRVKRAANRGEALTKQILAFSRKQTLKPEAIDLNEAVRAAHELFERMIGEDISLDMDLDGDVGSIRFDPAQFDQVIINLVVNARDAMPKGGEIRLSTGSRSLDSEAASRIGLEAGCYATLAIRDTGVGIPEELRQKIFEPFFSTKGPGRGTGLGLATTLGILERHGAGVDVESRRGWGTCFEIFFPRVAGVPAMTATADLVRMQPLAERGGKTLLVVEDDGLLRELMREVLEEEGYVVLLAGGPCEAVEMAASHIGDIDLLVSDVVMPGGGGFSLAKRLAPKRPNLRVLYMSGYTDRLLSESGGLSKQDAFLLKPFGNDELVEKIQEVLADG